MRRDHQVHFSDHGSTTLQPMLELGVELGGADIPRDDLYLVKKGGDLFVEWMVQR